MRNRFAIGLLIFILLFFAPMWAINKLDRVKTNRVIANHANSLLYITREHKEMQIDVARLIESNYKLIGRIKENEVVIDSFKHLIKQKFPNFIKEGK